MQERVCPFVELLLTCEVPAGWWEAHVNKMLRVVSAAAKSAGVVCGAPGGARTTGRDFGLRNGPLSRRR
jgi:hypothetical protein